MRLYEFIDSKTYNASNKNAAKTLDKLRQMWPTSDLAWALRIRRRQQSFRGGTARSGRPSR